MKGVWFFGLLLMLTVWACQNQSRQSQNQQLQQKWQQFIVQKDSLFKHADWSPIPQAERVNFKGLHYFAYDPSWRLELPLYLYPNPQKMIIQGSKPGDERPALRYGYFQFARNGVPIKLDVIKILPQRPGEEGHLFLGFWDKTSGEETYAGGRYIDLNQVGENRYIVDFNYAYNPYCAYSDRYSCAIPPMTNQIPVAVRAGEKKYKEHH